MKAILNVAVGSWYPRGQERLLNTISANGNYNGNYLFYNNCYPTGCPEHSQLQYGFKFFAIKEAIRRNYTKIIWLDAAIICKNPIWPLFDILKKEGYFFIKNNKIGEWSSDICLEKFNISRDDAMNLDEISGGCFGLDLNNSIVRKFLKELSYRIEERVCFNGSHVNNDNQVSTDIRVLGHRHDQTVMSLIIHQLGMSINNNIALQTGHEIMSYNVNETNTIFLNNGM